VGCHLPDRLVFPLKKSGPLGSLLNGEKDFLSLSSREISGFGVKEETI